MRISELKDKRIAIFGYGREGKSTEHVLKNAFPDGTIEILDEAKGKISADILKKFEIVVISPGISIYREDIVEAKKAGVTFTTHANIWFAEHPEAFTICVTGTKGKSTTASLVCHFLKSLGKKAVLGGNFGVPLFELPDTGTEYYVIELSSYQIATLVAKPKLVLLLNLYPEHLDWHKSAEQYIADKLKIMDLSEDSMRISNSQDPLSLKNLSKAQQHMGFGGKEEIHHLGKEVYNGSSSLFFAEGLKLIGEHNLDNLCGALSVIKALGLPFEKCGEFLTGFKPLPHRMSVIGEKDGITFINDSISTIPEAAIAAISTLKGKRITALLGGFDRGRDLNQFARTLSELNLENIVTMGESGKRLMACLRELEMAKKEGFPTLYQAQSLKDAVQHAKNITKREGVVLLSPASPSYGEFKNFEERGDLFTQYCGF